jgi:hypothetical protein
MQALERSQQISDQIQFPQKRTHSNMAPSNNQELQMSEVFNVRNNRKKLALAAY